MNGRGSLAQQPGSKPTGLFGCQFLKPKYFKTIVLKASAKQNHGLEKKVPITVFKTPKCQHFQQYCGFKNLLHPNTSLIFKTKVFC
jgi:hypothetical protein